MAGRTETVAPPYDLHAVRAPRSSARRAPASSTPGPPPATVYVPPPRRGRAPTRDTDEGRSRIRTATSAPTEAPPAPASEHNFDDFDSLVGPALIFVDLLAAIFRIQRRGHGRTAPASAASELRKNGPRSFRETLSARDLPHLGFVSYGWPVVVVRSPAGDDYRPLDPDRRADLEPRRSSNDGLGGRHLVVIYDGSSARRSTPSLFTVESVLAQNGVAIRDGAGRLIGSPVEVYGIGGAQGGGRPSSSPSTTGFEPTSRWGGLRPLRLSGRQPSSAWGRHSPRPLGQDGVTVVTAAKVLGLATPATSGRASPVHRTDEQAEDEPKPPPAGPGRRRSGRRQLGRPSPPASWSCRDGRGGKIRAERGARSAAPQGAHRSPSSPRPRLPGSAPAMNLPATRADRGRGRCSPGETWRTISTPGRRSSSRTLGEGLTR